MVCSESICSSKDRDIRLIISRTLHGIGDERTLSLFLTSEWVEWESLWLLSSTVPKGTSKCVCFFCFFCLFLLLFLF